MALPRWASGGLAALILSGLTPVSATSSHGAAQRSTPAAAISAGGAWNWQNPLPQGNTLNGITCPAPQACIAVGANGTIIATTTGGDNWFGMRSGTVNNLNAITCASASACFVTGDNGTILATRNGGITWSSQSSGVTIHVGAISCPTTLICFALTYADYPVWSGPILHTSDGGATWSALPTTTTARWGQAISCPTSTVCFAISGGPLMVTLNGGLTWSTLSGVTNPTAITCLTTERCFAADGEAQVDVTSNGGLAWTATTLPPPFFANSAFALALNCPSTASCVAVGWYGNVAATATGGATWTTESSGVGNPNDPENLNSVTCQGPSTCWAVGTNGHIISTTNGGAAWTSRSSGISDSLNAVSCALATTCEAVGTGAVAATKDGTSWFHQATLSANLNAVSCPSSTTCFAAGWSGAILETSDTVTWLTQTAGTAQALFGVSCPSTSTCFVSGDAGTILATTNGGATWTGESSGTANRLYSVDCPATSTCLAVGDGGTVLATTDGVNWSAKASPTTDQLRSISCPTTSNCWMVGDIGIFATTDGGATWTNQNSNGSMKSIDCQSTTTCTAVGASILSTTDGGATWPTHQGGGASVSCPGATLCYAVGGMDIFASTGSIPVCGGVTVTSDKVSPQPGGTHVTFTAAAPGCTNPVYEFWLWSSSGGWQMRQAYNTTATFVLDTTGMMPGTYTIDVWVNWAGSVFGAGGYDSFGLESWVVGGCDYASMTPNPGGVAGTDIFTVTAGGAGCGTPLYEFWLYSVATGWQLKQPYSTKNNWSIDTSTLVPGTYSVDAWVKQQGSPLQYETWALSTIPKGACGSNATTTITPTQPSPQSVGTTVNLSVASSCGVNPSYRYWTFPGQRNSWQILRDYSAMPTFDWSTSNYTPGTQSLVVHVNPATDTWGLLSYSLLGCQSAGLSAGPISAQGQVVLTANAPSCSSPEFQFWIYDADGGGWRILQDFSPLNTYTFAPARPGTYALVVYVKQQGSSAAFDSFALLSATAN